MPTFAEERAQYPLCPYCMHPKPLHPYMGTIIVCQCEELLREAMLIHSLQGAHFIVGDRTHGNTFYSVPRPAARPDAFAFDGDSESREYTEVRS